jgi:predicted lipoprotein with Yx(FWY)xxD motif
MVMLRRRNLNSVVTFLAIFAIIYITACSPASPASNSTQAVVNTTSTSTALSAPAILAETPTNGSAGIAISGQTPMVKVSNQAVGNRAVKIDEVVSQGPGWVVIYNMQNGQPEDPIGHVLVNDGSTHNITVPIDTGRVTGTLYVLLHTDKGVIGKFEFPGPDTPELNGIHLVDGTIETNVKQAQATNDNSNTTANLNNNASPTSTPDSGYGNSNGMNMNTPPNGNGYGSSMSGDMVNNWPTASGVNPSVIVANQPILQGHVIVPEVTSPMEGWIVIHIAYPDGSVGPMIGWTHVHTGNNLEVVVPLTNPTPGALLSAMLHKNVANSSMPQFPGEDEPIFVNGNMINPSFQVTDSDHADLVITLGNTPETANYLVDNSGRSLYVSLADPPGQSKCDAVCLKSWQPLLVTGKIVVGTGIQATKVGIITRPDGKRQATYNNAPLYRYVQDQKPGDVNGQGVGGDWYLVAP